MVSSLKSADYFLGFLLSLLCCLLCMFVHVWSPSVVTSSLTGEFRVGCLILWVRMQALLAAHSSLALWLSVPRGGSARPVLLSSLHPQGRRPSPRGPSVRWALSRLSQDWYLDSLTLPDPSESEAQSPSAAGFSERNQAGLLSAGSAADTAPGHPCALTREHPLPGLPWARPAWPDGLDSSDSRSHRPGGWSPRHQRNLAASQSLSPWCVGRLPSVSAPNLFLEGSQSYWVRAPPIWPHFILVPFKHSISKGSQILRFQQLDFAYQFWGLVQPRTFVDALWRKACLSCW